MTPPVKHSRFPFVRSPEGFHRRRTREKKIGSCGSTGEGGGELQGVPDVPEQMNGDLWVEQQGVRKAENERKLLIQRQTAPGLGLLTSASLALEGSEDRKGVSEKSPRLKVGLLCYAGLRADDNAQRN